MSALLTCEEAAQRLGVHVATLRAWIREGRVPAYRLGQRFTRVDWEDLLSALSGPEAELTPRRTEEEGRR